jgi:DNA-directed RNA polymerase subunit RPC12/RpoP
MKCGNCGIEMRFAGNGQWWCDNPDCVNDGDNEYLPLPDEAHMVTGDDDGYCVFCGEEIEVSDDGYLKCRNCGYDEGYEKGKVG